MKKPTKTKKATKPYGASLNTMGRTYLSDGETVVDTLNNLKPQGTIKTKCILTVTKGDKRKERILTGRFANRMFNLSPFIREITIKQVSTMFDF